MPTSGKAPVVERFWARVERRGPQACWPWLGSKMVNGYGYFKEAGQFHYAHRFSYRFHKGLLPKLVRHSCDNPSCCNPDHLFAGTKASNADDMFRRHRHPNTRMTMRHLAIFREMTASGISQRDIARIFGIHFITVWKLLKGRIRPLRA